MLSDHNLMLGLLKWMTECGHLKRVPRSGWLRAGIANPESVAEHSFRTALIGFLLAILEGGDEKMAALLSLLHDLPESRISDLDHINKDYLKPPSNLEEEVLSDQLKGLPPAVRDKLEEIGKRNGIEERCVRDADRLECALQAAEYVTYGHRQAVKILKDSVDSLEGETAQYLGDLLLGLYEDNRLECILQWWE